MGSLVPPDPSSSQKDKPRVWYRPDPAASGPMQLATQPVWPNEQSGDTQDVFRVTHMEGSISPSIPRIRRFDGRRIPTPRKSAVVFDQFDDLNDTLILLQVRKQKRAAAAHPAAIPVHDIQ